MAAMQISQVVTISPYVNFFLKADIEDQYMHLDSTFDALSIGTNYRFQFHRLVGDFWEKSWFFVIFTQSFQ